MTLAGVWADGKDKDFSIGAVASHVFETAGTYSVTCKTYNQTLTLIDTDTFVVTVTDPDTVFSATDTVCISDVANDDFTGAPTGALEVTTDDLTVLSTHLVSGKRVLLHRGSSWAVSDRLVSSDVIATAQLGAYGTGTNPDSFGIFDNAPSVAVSGMSAGNSLVSLNQKNDFRITEISFSGEKSDVYDCIRGAGGIQEVLLHKVKVSGFNNSVEISWYNGTGSEQVGGVSLVSSRIGDSYTNVLFCGSEDFSLSGNEIRNADISHVTRLWWVYKGVVQHNYISGASVVSGDGRSALKFHGPKESQVIPYDGTPITGYPARTSYVVISNNVFGSSGPWPVGFGPQNDVSDERLQDIVFERNRYIADYGVVDTRVTVGLRFMCHYTSVRNNIVDLTGGSTGGFGIQIPQYPATPAPSNIEIYNNTIYRGNDGLDQSGYFIGVDIDPDVSSSIIRNNLVSFPYSTGIIDLIRDDSGVATVSNNLLTDTPYFVDPENVNPLSRDFHLTSGSTASIGQGYNVPVLHDFDGSLRGVPYDIGAYVYEAHIMTTFIPAGGWASNKFKMPEGTDLTVADSLQNMAGDGPVYFDGSGNALATDFTEPEVNNNKQVYACLEVGGTGVYQYSDQLTNAQDGDAKDFSLTCFGVTYEAEQVTYEGGNVTHA